VSHLSASEHHAHGKSYVDSIMKPYEEIPNSNGMKLLRDVSHIDFGSKYNIVVRTMMEDFWHKVITAADSYRVCVLGLPGIGKSMSTCILIRLLLTQQETVVFRVCRRDSLGCTKNDHFYVFTPSMSSHDIDVKVIAETEF
jgi:hypothetical protein